MHAPKGSGHNLLRFSLCAALFLMQSLSFCQGEAAADLFSGFLEWDFTSLSTSARDSNGVSSKTKTGDFMQRYNLSLNTNLAPSVRVTANSLIQSDLNRSETNGTVTHTSDLMLLPSIDLIMANQIYNAGAGYSRRQETTETSGVATETNINEDYHATLGLKPEGLPSLSLLLSRNNAYDVARLQEDTTNDRVSFGGRYLPVKDLDLRYQLDYSDTNDWLKELEVKQTMHSGHAAYGGQFFNQRINLDTSYGITHQATTVLAKGTGIVEFPLTPFAGLSSLNDTPTVGALNQLPALIDTNLSVSSGVNLGVQPNPAPAGDSNRNLGIDFLSPTEVSRLKVWVDRDITPVAGYFHWALYASPDGQIWTQLPPPASVTFGPLQNRFVIDFSPVTFRYIKVVVAPLAAAQAALAPAFQNPERIFVTEIQAFDERPAGLTQREIVNVAEVYSLDVKTKLFDSPYLAYDASLFLTHTAPGQLTTYTFANSLLLNHSFLETFTLAGRVGREDGQDSLGHRVAYTYGASLAATPLPTLTNTLAYSGRSEQIQGRTNISNSVFLNNTIELYRGVSLNAGGGASFLTNETGDQSRSLNAMFGANVLPRKDLSLSIYYTTSKIQVINGITGRQTDNSSQRGDLTVSYRPFTSLYLSSSFAVLEQAGRKTDVSQNYGINWAPFSDGALQFGFSYNQSLRNINGETSRVITPTAIWQITTRTTLQLAFPMVTTESDLGTTESQVISAVLRTSF